jgi:hypothetical protein
MTSVVSRFKKSRTEFTMHFNCGANDLFRDLIELISHQQRQMQEFCDFKLFCGSFAQF